MIYIGCVAVILAAFMIWREYVSFLGRELSFCRAYLDALSDLNEKMRCYLDSPREWAEKYENEELIRCGFITRLRSGEDILSAYKNTRSQVELNESADEILESCFSRLGEGYLDTELNTIELSSQKLAKVESALTEDLSRKSKVAGAFLGAFASGLIILII